jgi:hypothetical protein
MGEGIEYPSKGIGLLAIYRKSLPTNGDAIKYQLYVGDVIHQAQNYTLASYLIMFWAPK